MLYHRTKLLLTAYAMPERASSGTMSHAVSMSFMKASWSRRASGNCAVGISSSGIRWAAIDATLTMAEPSPAAPKKTSLTLSVPIALVRMTYSASPMLGLTPAVWITDATVPSPDAVSNSRPTAPRSVTSQLTTVGVIPTSFSAAAAPSSRSCLTSARTTVWARPTILAVARPMPPAPPVITVT